MNRNNTSYPKYVEQILIKSNCEQYADGKGKMLINQCLVNEYLIRTNSRGILVFHGFGTGKTRLSIISAKNLGYKNTIIMAPKSVHHQFERVMNKIKLKASLISLKSSNILDKISSLDNTLLIVDEAHNFFNSITNGSKNAIELYDLIMKSRNLKIIFMTGSPIINDGFELVCCFNMLSGFRLFNENKEMFDSVFTDNRGYLKNVNIFKNRIAGLVSYYGEWVKDAKQSSLPEIINEVIKIPMSMKQFQIYSNYRDREIEEDKRFRKKQENNRFNSKSGSGTYRVKTRKASNMAPFNPSDAELQGPNVAPKFHKMLDLITNKHKNQIGIVYSDFVNECGLQDIARFLTLNGWMEWDYNEDKKNKIPLFGIVDGKTSDRDRNELSRIFSSPENIKGDLIKLLLIGPAAAEGFSLKNGRFAILMGPFFHPTRTDQAKYRVIRHGSHDLLPKKDRNVTIYTLIAISPYDDIKESLKEHESTDLFLYRLSNKKRIRNLTYYKAMVEVSIDCNIYKKLLMKTDKKKAKVINCFQCSPTDKKLFNINVKDDLKNPNPCTHDQEVKKLKNLEVDGKIYGYEKIIKKTDGIETTLFNFYRFNENIDSYTKISRGDNIFPILYEHVSKR